jgi:hypothetical protein
MQPIGRHFTQIVGCDKRLIDSLGIRIFPRRLFAEPAHNYLTRLARFFFAASSMKIIKMTIATSQITNAKTLSGQSKTASAIFCTPPQPIEAGVRNPKEV